MKILKIVGIILIVFILGFVGYSATLDGKYDVSRSIQIDENPDAVYNIVSDLETWPKWSLWYLRDSTMTSEFSEKTKGEGASYSWESEQSGNGSLTILTAEPGKSMTTDISFEGMGGSNGYWTFEDKDHGTYLTWGFKGEMPFLFRFMAQGMDVAIGPDFEAGLENIKALAESVDREFFEIDSTTLESKDYYYVEVKGTFDKMNSQLFAENYGKIMGYLGGTEEASKIMTGSPFTINNEWNEVDKTFSMEVAIPAESDLPGNDEVKKGKSYGGHVIYIDHYGPYEKTANAHEDLNVFMESYKIESNGSPMEVYVTDPEMEPDTSKWLTKIIYPYKGLKE